MLLVHSIQELGVQSSIAFPVQVCTGKATLKSQDEVKTVVVQVD